MSTFSGLTAASSALLAARRGIDLVGQNTANQITPGYTRQRLDLSAIDAVAVSGRFSTFAQPGHGVSVDGVSRLGDAVLDARVRDTLAASGYWATRAGVAATAEATLAEPTADGLADRMSQFWAGWQELSNAPDSPAAAAVVLTGAEALAGQIADGYRAITGQWADARGRAEVMVAQVNAAAEQIADLNGAIRDAAASGASVNELVDRRNVLAQTVARLSGAVGTVEPNGTLTLRLDGNALVSGGTARGLTVTGPATLGAEGSVQLSWQGGPGRALAGGELGGTLAALASADDGGVLAGLADTYNALATMLAETVNAQHRQGVRADGAAGGDFFALAATGPAALGLRVVPTGPGDLALAAPGAGALDGSNADALALIGTRTDGPDALWADAISRLAVSTATDAGRASRADTAAVAAVSAQQSLAGVDPDEETVNLMTYQTLYQAAARVITAVDETLDVLINRTGIVGR